MVSTCLRIQLLSHVKYISLVPSLKPPLYSASVCTPRCMRVCVCVLVSSQQDSRA